MESYVRRSWLIVPAHDQNRLAEAASSGADVIVLDIEDTVHETKKREARERIRDAIPQMTSLGAEVFVRSDFELFYADMDASVWRGINGVVLPKLTSVAQVVEADHILEEFELKRGVAKLPPVGEVHEADDPRGPEQALEIHLCLDTGRANWDAVQLIQACSRVQSVSLGRADLVMDLREEPSGDLHLMPYLMQRLIIVAGNTGVQPIGAWWRATSRGLVASPEETLKAGITGRQAGFRGALCMRANQVEPLNIGFTPSNEEVSYARRVVEAVARATDRGNSTATVDGDTVGVGIAAAAAGLLERADACKARDESKNLVAAQAAEGLSAGG
jgi:citrate lyase subunit beta/citryl-CoA lyase